MSRIHKIPESVLVVIHTPALDVLLIRRADAGTWQSVTGSKDAPDEPFVITAIREVAEETGLGDLRLRAEIETIDWYFRFRGRLIHKVCHFYLMESDSAVTSPQRDEGITACRWETFERAAELVSYENARAVLRRAHELVNAAPTSAT